MQQNNQGALEAVRRFLLGDIVELFIILNLPRDDIHIDGDFAELPDKMAIAHRPTVDYAPAEFYTERESWRGSFTEWLRDEE